LGRRAVAASLLLRATPKTAAYSISAPAPAGCGRQVYWRCVSDVFFGSAAIGALEVSCADPNVIYAGTGETAIRLDVSYGDGVYKSTDAGRTWSHLGLGATRFIGRIRIHPKDSDLVYVAALGDAFGENAERGVFRSRDGGKTWSKVLYRDANSGAVDLSMDPHNPRILFAAFWQARRNFWNISSGGPGSGLFRSVDGGETWTEISRNPGLPAPSWQARRCRITRLPGPRLGAGRDGGR
jgi:photosystem II stability/assembly factor-like uncharacterized protein